MDTKRFEAIIMMIVPDVINLISKNYGCSEIEASEMFYNSDVYSFLEREETKIWHFSPLTLFNMFDEEKKTGKFEFPEEAC